VSVSEISRARIQRLSRNGQFGEQYGFEFVRGDAGVSERISGCFIGRNFEDGNRERRAFIASGKFFWPNSAWLCRGFDRNSMPKIDIALCENCGFRWYGELFDSWRLGFRLSYVFC